jgi:hypothetical protein
MTTPFDQLTDAVNTLIATHQALQTQHAAVQQQLAQSNEQAASLAQTIETLIAPPPPADPIPATPAPAPVPTQPAAPTAYGRHAGDK